MRESERSMAVDHLFFYSRPRGTASVTCSDMETSLLRYPHPHVLIIPSIFPIN